MAFVAGAALRGFRVKRLRLEAAKANTCGLDDALRVELAQLVDGWRGAFVGEFEVAAELAVFDAHVLPTSDRLGGVVVPQCDGVWLAKPQIPSARFDDI